MSAEMIEQGVQAIVAEVLGIDTGRILVKAETRLLGALPEFDSMAVVSVLTALEEHFGVAFDDDEIDASLFETVGSLTRFVATKLG